VSDAGAAAGRPAADAAGRRVNGDAAAPVQVDSRRILLIGTAIWALVFLALLPFWSWLGRHDHRIWLWTCAAGVVVGLSGSVLARKHRAEGRTG
jgi:Protein of unknown function (DUF2530)